MTRSNLFAFMVAASFVLLMVTVSVSLPGCVEKSHSLSYVPGFICARDEVTSVARREFIVQCAAAANPHSDEEGEDLVRECARVAGKTCSTVPAALTTWDGRGAGHHSVACKDAVGPLFELAREEGCKGRQLKEER